LGSVLNPMLDQNEDLTAKMSMRFSELAVDLASFYNTAEPQALWALRSALTGEAEPMKKFGVVMNEATLKEFAMTQGIKKSVKEMNNAEKTQLRYDFILKQTVKTHGDAIKTSAGWANLTKRVGGRIRDLATDIGLRFLPLAEKMLNWTLDMIDAGIRLYKVTLAPLVKFFANLPSLSQKLLLLGAGLILLVGNFGKVSKAIRLLMSPMGKFFLLIGLLVLILEDLYTWAEGGDSMFKRLFQTFDEITGLNLTEYLENILKWFLRLSEDPVKAFEEIFATLEEFGHWVKVAFLDVWDIAVKWFNENVKDPITSFFTDIVVKIKDLVNRFPALMKVAQKLGGLFGFGGNEGKTTGPKKVTPSTLIPPVPSGAGVGNVNQDNRMHVEVHPSVGMNEEELANRVIEKTREERKRNNRNTMGAFQQAKP